MKRPYELLPMPAPREHDPGPVFFYDNFVKPLVPDMIQMMDTGLLIDDKAVDDLRVVIRDVLKSVEDRLKDNVLIQQYQQQVLPEAQKKHEEQATAAVRTIEYYLKEFKDSDMTHRTWVVNTYLKKIGKSKDCKDKWSMKDLKQYNFWLHDLFLRALIEKRELKTNTHVLEGMQALAEYKLELWNRPRYEKAQKKVDIQPFNPNSDKQKREFFEMLGIEPLATSKKTGDASWARDQIEALLESVTDPDLIEVLECLVDQSFSAIIQSNFIKAFDAYTIDGVLHGNIKLFGTKTFRPTSNSPNLLNAPSSRSIYAKPLKKCFVAPEGYVVYTADLSALEDRVMANISQDPNKLAIFLENLDGHSLAAVYYFGQRVFDLVGDISNPKEASKKLAGLVDAKNGTAKQIRTDAKPANFSLAYGAFPPKVAQTIRCTLEEAENFFNMYHNELYPGVTDYRENYVLQTVKQHGYIHLGLGCRMYASDAEASIRTLTNGTIQFWSILTLIAVNELNHRIRQERLEQEIQITSTIYDSIYTQALADPEVLQWLNNNMIEVLTVPYLEDQIIPNEADGEIGLNWADLYKIPNNASVEQIREVLNEFL